jgi:hypothetical protein
MFTSGTQALQGRTVNHDPKPYSTAANTPERRAATATDDGIEWYDPRPEFDVVDNPILAAFRKYYPKDRPEDWVWGIDNGHNDPATPEQIDHARRVLERLARVVLE